MIKCMDCQQEFENYDDVDSPCPYNGYKGEHNFPEEEKGE